MQSMEPELTPTSRHTTRYLIPVLALLCIIFIGVSVYLYSIVSARPQQKSVAETNSAATKKKISVPEGAVKISGCIPHEGEHWVEVDKLPAGPYYVAYNGVVTALDYMFTEADIPGKDFAHKSLQEEVAYMQENDMDLSDLVHHLDQEYGVPGDVPVKSWSIHWTPPHGGMIEPHFDMHLYLVDQNELESICPDAPMDSVLPQDIYQELKRLGVPVPEMGPPPDEQATPAGAVHD